MEHADLEVEVVALRQTVRDLGSDLGSLAARCNQIQGAASKRIAELSAQLEAARAELADLKKREPGSPEEAYALSVTGSLNAR